MNLKLNLYLLVLLSFATALTSCAHHVMRGTVAMKAGDEEAHVCLGNNEVKPGDKVVFFENDCQRTGGWESGSGSIECVKKRLGEGRVTRVLNEHYSVVRPEPGVSIREGSVVEKL